MNSEYTNRINFVHQELCDWSWPISTSTIIKFPKCFKDYVLRGGLDPEIDITYDLWYHFMEEGFP